MIDPDMGKKDRKSPKETAESFGVGKLTRHIFVCLGPDCVDKDDGEKTWDYVKKRMKELEHRRRERAVLPHESGLPAHLRQGADRARLSRRGVVPKVTPDNAERIIQEHLIGGQVVEDLCFAKNPLPLTRK